jgi:hypothetical protein
MRFNSFQEITLTSTLEISSVTLSDSGVYTCQSGLKDDPDSVLATANVTVIVISGTTYFSFRTICIGGVGWGWGGGGVWGGWWGAVLELE